jgi:hypothetical protein
MPIAFLALGAPDDARNDTGHGQVWASDPGHVPGQFITRLSERGTYGAACDKPIFPYEKSS